MTTKKIIVSVINDLSSDQRVNRVCTTLQNNGFDVLLIGRKFKNSKPIDNRSYKTKRYKLLFNKSFLFYLEINFRFFWILLFSKYDFLLSNDLDTLLCNSLAARIRRKRMYYDSHELFTEMPELQNQNFKKRIWAFIEKISIRKSYASYTVCQPIADYYNKKYGINMQVIRNVPTKKELIIPYNERKNVLIYQGALNLERGIEIMISAMQYLSDYQLIIAGKGDVENDLKKLCSELKLDDKIVFTGNIDIFTLHKYTQQAKIGFSLEQGKSMNYKFALPNKIFDYIQAETPIICADLPEMRKLVENFKIGEVFSEKDSKSLAELVKKIIAENADYYSQNCNLAKEILNWENEEKKLLTIYQGGF